MTVWHLDSNKKIRPPKAVKKTDLYWWVKQCFVDAIWVEP